MVTSKSASTGKKSATKTTDTSDKPSGKASDTTKDKQNPTKKDKNAADKNKDKSKKIDKPENEVEKKSADVVDICSSGSSSPPRKKPKIVKSAPEVVAKEESSTKTNKDEHPCKPTKISTKSPVVMDLTLSPDATGSELKSFSTSKTTIKLAPKVTSSSKKKGEPDESGVIADDPAEATLVNTTTEEVENAEEASDDVQIIEWDAPTEWYKKPTGLPYWRECEVPVDVISAIILQWVKLEKRIHTKGRHLPISEIMKELHVTEEEVKRALNIGLGKPVPLGLPSKSLPPSIKKLLEETWNNFFQWQKERKKEGANLGWDLYTTQLYTALSNPGMTAWKGIKRAMKLMVDVEVVDVNRSARSKLIFESVVTMKHYVEMYKEVFAVRPKKLMKDVLWTWKWISSKKPYSILESITPKEYEMIKELAYRLSRNKGLPKALTRYNIAVSPCESWVFGWSMKRFIKAGERRTTNASANSKNKNCRRIYKLLKDLINEKHENFQYTSMTVNRNLQCQPHRDKRNCGLSYIIAFGNFTGGDLNYEISPGWTESFDYKNKWMLFNGNHLHGNKPFKGTRFTVVYYKHSTIAKELEAMATDEQRITGVNFKPP